MKSPCMLEITHLKKHESKKDHKRSSEMILSKLFQKKTIWVLLKQRTEKGTELNVNDAKDEMIGLSVRLIELTLKKVSEKKILWELFFFKWQTIGKGKAKTGYLRRLIKVIKP